MTSISRRIPPYATLERLLTHAGVTDGARQVFSDWPHLRNVAGLFVAYISPWLVVDGQNLAEHTLKAAIQAYQANRAHGHDEAHRGFIEALARSAETLVRVRISVLSRDGLWMIWKYDEPLTRLMKRHRRASIQIRMRDTPIGKTAVLVQLLAAISSTDMMDSAGIDLHRMLKEAAAT